MSSPVSKIKYGNVSLSKFENENTKDGKSFTTSSFTPQKAYKVGDEWKFSSSFKPSELVFLIQACQEALIDYYRKDEPKPQPQQSNDVPF